MPTLRESPAERSVDSTVRNSSDGQVSTVSGGALWWKGPWSWPAVTWIAVIHVGALFAPLFISWQAVLLTLFLHWLTGGIGVCLGYHRLLTHDSFRTYRPVRYLLSIFGGLSGEGSPVYWTATHRKHHALSDQPGDPHSPHDGTWWSHMLWTMRYESAEDRAAHCRRWCPDLLKDPGMVVLDTHFLLCHIAMGLILGAVGYAMGGAYLATSFIVWGMFARMAFVLHSTWLVNSASHLWGYCNYKTTDDSRNNWWVALITYGEGWHNNHHAYPRMARHGHRWWEFDATFLTIRLLERFGLAWDVVDGHHLKAQLDHTVITPEKKSINLADSKFHRPQPRTGIPHPVPSGSGEETPVAVQTSSASVE